MPNKILSSISRNVSNTRMRDFYDIYILYQIHGGNLSAPVFRGALIATAKKRRTFMQTKDAAAVFDEIEQSPTVEKLWNSYQKKYSYALELSWYMVMSSVRILFLTCNL